MGRGNNQMVTIMKAESQLGTAMFVVNNTIWYCYESNHPCFVKGQNYSTPIFEGEEITDIWINDYGLELINKLK